MRHQSLTFAHIMESNLLYFDEGQQEVCRDICNRLRIDFFPSLDGKSKFRLEKELQHFLEEEILEREKVSTSDPIFGKDNLDKFRKSGHNVLFVYERGEGGGPEVLRGVVHISDYNRNVVLAAIQEDVLNFEQLLRQYLIMIGKTNDDMLQYFRYKAKKNDHFAKKLEWAESEDGLKALEKLGPFQGFDFRDLLFFIQSSRNKVPLGLSKDAPEQLGDLRNLAMHAKNAVELKAERLYNYDSLEKLIEDLDLLKKEYLNTLAALNAKNREFFRARNRAALEMIREYGTSSLAQLLANV